MLDAEDHRGHDHCCKNGLSGGSKVQEMEIEGGFEDLGDEGAIIDGKSKHTNIMEYKYKYDLGYEGAVLHETGKTDHHQSSREQSSRLSLHAAGAVDRRPDVVCLKLILLGNQVCTWRRSRRWAWRRRRSR